MLYCGQSSYAAIQEIACLFDVNQMIRNTLAFDYSRYGAGTLAAELDADLLPAA